MRAGRRRREERGKGGEGGKPTRTVLTAPSQPVQSAVSDRSRGGGSWRRGSPSRIRKTQLRWAAGRGLGEGNGNHYDSLSRPPQAGRFPQRKLGDRNQVRPREKRHRVQSASFPGQPSHWPKAMSFPPPPPPPGSSAPAR